MNSNTCWECATLTVACITAAYVIRNVFSHFRKTNHTGVGADFSWTLRQQAELGPVPISGTFSQ